MLPPLPPAEIRFMADDDDDFLRIGEEQVKSLWRHARMRPTDHVLDVGCGYGRLAHALLRDPRFVGRYTGLDPLAKQVQWCQEHLADERFRFIHLDVVNERYNPAGNTAAADVVLPVVAGSVDVAMLASVFTHMWPADVVRYLHQVRKSLRRGGRGFATFFLTNDSWRDLDRKGRPRYSLPHHHTDFCRFHDDNNPLHVVAYEQRWVTEQMRAAGLIVEKVLLGTWAGRPSGETRQDVVVFRRQGLARAGVHVARARIEG